MPRLDRLWYEIDAQTKGFDEGVLQSGKQLKAFVDYAKGHPLAVLGALGAAAIAAGAKLAQMGAEFEREMAKVQTVARTTTYDLARLREGVGAIFTDLPIRDLNELTDGLYEVISAGIATSESLEFIRVSAEAAVGGATDVKTAVDGLTSAVNAYRDSGITVREVSDILFTTVAAGRTTFGQLANSMGQVVGITSTLKVPLEEVGAVIAQLTLTGLSTAESITGIRSAIVNILRPTEDFAKQFPELAAQFNEGKLRGDGFVKFLTDLQTAANGNSEVFKALFSDVQGYNAVQTLMRDRGVGLVAMLDKTRHSAGATAEATKIMAETTDAANQRLKNELSLTLKELGTDLLPGYNAGLRAALTIMESIDRVLSGGTAGRVRELADAVRAMRAPEDQSREGIIAQAARETVRALPMIGPVVDALREISGANAPRTTQGKASRLAAAIREAGDALNALPLDQLREIERFLNEGRADPQVANAMTVVADAIEHRMEVDRAAARQRAQARREQSTQDAEAIATAEREGAAAAERARAYAGEASTVQTATRKRAAALSEITAAEGKLREAVEAGRVAQAAGDVDSVAKARRQAEAARTSIDAQTATIKESDEVLRQHALSIAETYTNLQSQVGEALARGTQTGVDDAIVALARYEANLDQLEAKARKKFPALRAEADRLRGEIGVTETRERQTATRKVDGILAEGAQSQVTALQHALADLLREIDKSNAEFTKLGKAPLVTDAQRAQIVDMKQSMIAVTAATEEATRAVEAFAVADAERAREQAARAARITTTDPAARARALAEVARQIAAEEADTARKRLAILDEQERKIRAQLALVPKGKEGDAARAKANAALAEILREQARLYGLVVDGANAAADAEEKRRQAMLQVVGDVTSIASAALDAANQMGLLSDKSARALEEVIGLGEGIARIAAGDIVGGVVQTIKSVGGLYNALSNRDEIKQARDETLVAMRSLESALLELRDAFLQDVSTDQAERDLAFVESAQARPGGRIEKDSKGQFYLDGSRILRDGEGNGPGRREDLAQLFEALGIRDVNGNDTRDEGRAFLAALDARYGTNLASFVDRDAPEGLLRMLELMPAAIRDAIADLGRYGDDVAGIIERVAFEFSVLGKSDPAEKFRATIDALTAGGVAFGEFADEFARLADPALTTADRDAIVGGILTRLREGGGAAGGIDFGALTPEQLRALVEQAAGVDDGATPPETPATEAASAAAGIIERVTYELDVLGRSDAAERVRAIAAALLQAATVDFGEFRDEIASLADPSLSTSTRDQIIAGVLARANGADTTGVDFGNLTPEEFRDLFRDLAEGTRPEDAAGPDGTGGFNVNRTITETTGTRMAGLLGTVAVHGARTADAAEAIAAVVTAGAFAPAMDAAATRDLLTALTAPPPPPLTAPVIPTGALGGTANAPAAPAAPSVVLHLDPGAVQVNVPAGTAATDARAIGDAVSDALVAKVAEKLAAIVAFQQFAAGVVPSTNAY